MQRLALSLLMALATAQRPPPPAEDGWRHVFMYDVLPADCGEVTDETFALKDYGNAAGDAYFAIRSVLPPLLCERCRNEENLPRGERGLCVRFNGIAVGTCYSEQAYEGVQVARKIAIEVPEGGSFGAYGACNPGEEEDQLCEYECVPNSATAPPPAEGIGVQQLTEEEICPLSIGRNISVEAGQEEDSVRALHYDYNLCRLLDGLWYSVGNASYAGEHWRNPHLVKSIDSACQMRVLHQRVQTHRGTACFDACERTGNSTTEGAYDQESPCYIRCFYESLLGPAADTSDFTPGQGMTAQEIEEAWLAGFDECPDYEEATARRGVRARGSRRHGRALLP